MKIPLAILVSYLALLIVGLAGGISKPENEHVKISISATPSELKAGAQAQLLISLKPKKGYHIVTTPPMEIKLDSVSGIQVIGKLQIPQSTNKDYVETSKPIKQRITLASRLKPGTATIKGTLTYFYCSDAEGWCSKFKQPIELTIKIVK